MLYGAAKKMYESMTVEQLKHFTKRPTKKRRRKKHQSNKYVAKEVKMEDYEENVNLENDDEGNEAPTSTENEAEEQTEEIFEFDAGDGNIERMTSKELADRLANYRKLQSQIGKLHNERAELSKKLEELESKQKVEPEEKIDTEIDIDDYDDPDVIRKVLAKIETRTKELDEKLSKIPDIVSNIAEKKAEERAALQEYNKTLATHPKLKGMSEEVKKATANAAIEFGMMVNQKTGKDVYPDLASAIDGYLAAMAGEQKPVVTMQGFVKSLKVSGEQLSSTGTKSTDDVVKRYAKLETDEERAEFLSKLSDEEVKLIDNAVYNGEIQIYNLLKAVQNKRRLNYGSSIRYYWN